MRSERFLSEDSVLRPSPSAPDGGCRGSSQGFPFTPTLHAYAPNTHGNLSHRLTPQIHTHVPTDTHAHAEAQTSRQVFPFLCLSLGLNFVQPHMLCVREGGGRGRQGWHGANIYLWGLGQGCPPRSSWEGPQLSLCGFRNPPRGEGKHRGPLSRPEGLVPDPSLGVCKGKKWTQQDPGGSIELGGTTRPQFPALPPHCSNAGGSISKGGNPSHLPLHPCFPCVGWGGEGGRDIYLFPLFI